MASTSIQEVVQVPNNPILTKNLHCNYCYQNPKYLIFRYLDPEGGVRKYSSISRRPTLWRRGVGWVGGLEWKRTWKLEKYLSLGFNRVLACLKEDSSGKKSKLLHKFQAQGLGFTC